MITRKSTFFLGIFVFLIPFFGLPTFWKTFFIILSGAILVALSIQVSIQKRNVKPRIKKDRHNEILVDNISVYTPSVSNMENTFVTPLPPTPAIQTEIKKTPTRRRSSSSKNTSEKVI